MIKIERFRIAELDCISACNKTLVGKPGSAMILCHGFGAPGTDLVSIAEEMIGAASGKLDSTRFVFPAAPLEIEPGYDGRCWWPINMQRMQMAFAAGEVADIADIRPDELPDARARILAIVKWCGDYDHVPQSKVIIGGFSQGAMLALDVALALGGDLAGLLLWSGMLINQLEWRERAGKAKSMKIVQSHGMLDPVLPFQCGLNLRKVLTDAGHQLEFVQFQGYHQIPEQSLEASIRLAVSVLESSSSQQE